MLAQIVETIDDLTGSLADSRDLLEMAAEENDEGAVKDIVAEVERLREILEKLEFRASPTAHREAETAKAHRE